MKNFFGTTIEEALRDSTYEHLDTHYPDEVLNIETHLFDVTISAETCELGELDLGKHLWLNKQRWSRLIREYVPADPLHRFIEQAFEIYSGNSRKGATANMMFRDPPRSAKKHRWGGCLMGATFRGAQGKSKITFHSRTTYMGYIGFLDAAIAHAMASLIDEPSNIAFEWHISSQQLHCFKTYRS